MIEVCVEEKRLVITSVLSVSSQVACNGFISFITVYWTQQFVFERLNLHWL